MALTDVEIRSFKPREAVYKKADGGGLYLQINPTGTKLWRLKYRVGDREKKLSIGAYPDISLSEARRRRDEARQQLAASKDPSNEKRKEKLRSRLSAENTFAEIAKEYCEKRKRDGQKGWAPATATRSEYLLGLLRGSIGRMSAAGLACVAPLYEGLPDWADRVWQTFVAYLLVGALPLTVVFGLPVYFVLRSRARPSIWSCSAAGVAVLVLPWAILNLMMFTGMEEEYGGRHILVTRGHWTIWGWLYLFQSLCETVLLGLIAGVIFWLIMVADITWLKRPT